MEALLDRVLEHTKKLGVEYAEARMQHICGSSFVLVNGILQGSSFEEKTGLSIRLLVNNTFGFAHTDKLDEQSIRKAVEFAYTFAKLNKKLASIKLTPAKPIKAEFFVKEIKPILDTSVKEKIDYLKQLDSSIVNAAQKYISYSDCVDERFFLNTEGSQIKSRIPRASVFYLFTLKGNGLAQRMWEYGKTGGFEILEQRNLNKVLAEESNELFKVINGDKIPPGKYDLVVGPEVSGIIAHESCGHPFEADRILGREAAQAGESWIEPKMLGMQLAKDFVNVVDDPTIKDGNGFYLYDDEGIPAEPKYLIKEGKINCFLHNRESSAALNQKNNGSARAASYSVEPLVRMSNTFFKPGEQTEEELIEDVKKGIYFKNFMEWNIDDKRYNNKYTSAIAYLIENGKITKAIKPVSLEITTPALYAAIDAVGSNFELHSATCGKGEPMQGIPVSHGGGSLRLRGVKI
ncbi:MAG: TldD/PmbA family protein [Candidatus Nanoarchaeia archaeon]